MSTRRKPKEYYNPEDWPDVKPEGRGLSVDVMVKLNNSKKPFLAWFNFNDMRWYSNKGVIATTAFKWHEKR